MGWAHAIAPIVEETAHQQRLGLHPGGGVVRRLFRKLDLDRFEQFPVEDGGLFSGVDLTFERYFANIEPVTKQMGEGTAGEGDPANDLPGLQGAFLGDYASPSQVGHQQVEAAKVEIAPEDGADGLGFLLVDGDLSVLGVIAEGDNSADPESLAL